MDNTLFKAAITELQKEPKRKFTQGYDLIVNLKDLDLKKPTDQVDFYVQLPKGSGKTRKVCGLVGPELIEDSKANLDHTIVVTDFEKLSKTDIKKIADEYDFFVAQANIMPKVAATFGRIFGPRNKMPNPKAGCVVPPKANLSALKERLASTIRLKTKNSLIIQANVGNESLSDEDVYENVHVVYDSLVHHLPKEENNVKNVFMKKTMSKTVKVN
jgi:large subunit ribosomal protein L1